MAMVAVILIFYTVNTNGVFFLQRTALHGKKEIHTLIVFIYFNIFSFNNYGCFIYRFEENIFLPYLL